LGLTWVNRRYSHWTGNYVVWDTKMPIQRHRERAMFVESDTFCG